MAAYPWCTYTTSQFVSHIDLIANTQEPHILFNKAKRPKRVLTQKEALSGDQRTKAYTFTIPVHFWAESKEVYKESNQVLSIIQLKKTDYLEHKLHKEEEWTKKAYN